MGGGAGGIEALKCTNVDRRREGERGKGRERVEKGHTKKKTCISFPHARLTLALKWADLLTSLPRLADAPANRRSCTHSVEPAAAAW